MKTAEEILSKHTGETGIYLTHGMIRGSDALEAMGEYLQQSYASQPMSAEQVEDFNPEKQANIISIANDMFSTSPTVKADGRKPYNEDGTCKKCGGNQCDSDSHK